MHQQTQIGHTHFNIGAKWEQKKKLAGSVLEMRKKLICTVDGPSWQHILLGAVSLHKFKRGLDELLQKKSLQHHYEASLLNKFLLENPTVALLSPACPPLLLARGQNRARGCYTLTYCWCDSHQQSYPAWRLHPEVKVRDQKSCQRMLPEGLRKALLAQKPPPAPMEAK